jgi:hypothetical protein
MFEGLILAVQNTQEVYQYRFPDIELNLMHKVNNEHPGQAKTKFR